MLGWVCCVGIPGEVGGYANDYGLGVSVWLLVGHGERMRSLAGGRGREGEREGKNEREASGRRRRRDARWT